MAAGKGSFLAFVLEPTRMGYVYRYRRRQVIIFKCTDIYPQTKLLFICYCCIFTANISHKNE